MASREDARALVERIVDAYNRHDTDALVGLYHPDITYWSALGGEQKGLQAVRDHIEHLHEILPDERMAARTIITDGDVAVAEFESTGTNPAGRPYRIEFTEVFEIHDGVVRAIKVYLDPVAVEAAMS